VVVVVVRAALAAVAVSVVAVAGLLVVVDLLVVGDGAGAGGGPASAFTATPIAGGVRVAAVGSAHTIDRGAVERSKWERRRALPRLALPLHVPANRERAAD
jgi:hypothetical protein